MRAVVVALALLTGACGLTQREAARSVASITTHRAVVIPGPGEIEAGEEHEEQVDRAEIVALLVGLGAEVR